MRNRAVAFWGKGFRGVLSLLIAGPLLGVAAQCHAQVSPTDEYSKLIESAQHIGAMGAHPFGENVDLYTGALSFEVTDISVPGIGPALTLGRVLHTAEDSADAEDAITGMGGFWRPFGDWDLDIPRIETNAAWQLNVLGWLVGASSKNRCTGFSKPPPVQSTSPPDMDWAAVRWWYGYHLIVPGHGSQDLLDGGNPPAHQPSSGSYPIVTKQDWMIGCGVTASDGGEGFVALAPDGTRYTFAHLVYRPMPWMERPYGSSGNAIGGVHPMMNDADYLARYAAAMYVTQVQDRLGNTLTYNWNGNNLGSIIASDGRELDFSYNSGTSLIHSVTVKAAGGASARIWTYTYGGSSSMPTLTSVQLPDGSTWTYQIGNLESATLNTVGGSCTQNTLPTLQSGAVSGSMVAPSGLAATFTITPTLHGRSYVPKACWSPYSGSTTTYANIPNAYYQFSLTKEVLSGPGIPAQTWTWSYSAPNQSWTSDACASGNSCPSTVYMDVSNPLGQVVRYTFSNRFDASESLLQRTDHYSGAAGSTILRSETNTYANPTGGPWPGSYGSNLQARTNFAQTGELSPLAKHVTSQDGATFTTSVNSFDAYARATSKTESSSLGYSKTDTTSYYNDANLWVLGLVTQTTTNGIVTSQTSYDSLDRPINEYAFGKLVSTKTWNGDGTLASITDGNSHTTTFSNWYRSLPGKVTFADGTSQSAAVNGNGWITSVTDENGFATSYGYDAMGRLASITYPSGDDVAWNQTLLSFAPVAGSEYGIPAGHWKQTVHTGNGYAVTYLDAMWRPLVSERYDSGDKPATLSQTVTRYDASGRTVFTSYPANNVSSYATANTGTHTSYDALNRVTQVQQDSELGLLTTTTQYLVGFQTKVTDPRGYATTTSYQAWGEPATEYPVGVTAPEGQLTVIMRDAFGKPLSITRTGTAQGSPQITRYYVYDGYQQLCKRIDPESGASAFGYDNAGNVLWSASGLNLLGTTTCDASAAYGSGRRVDRTWDARDRLATLSFPDGNGNQTWTYMPDGLPAQIATANAGNTITNNYFYDKRRLMTREQLLGPIDRQGTNAGNFVWSNNYGHDANGSLSSSYNPKGMTIDYAPNALGQPTRAGYYATGASYYPDGALKQFTYGNGIVHTMAENTRGLPARLTDSGAQGQPAPQDAIYTYDASGNVSAIDDVTATNFDRSMTYDGLDRMAGVYSGLLGGQYNLGYGVWDNPTLSQHIGGSTSTYSYDSHNRLAAINNTARGTIPYTWDVQGNLVSGGGHSYQFDYGNRLRQVPGSESYMYDAYGRRVEQVGVTLPTIFRQYTYTGQLGFESDERNGAMRAYVYLGSHLVAIQDYTHNSVAYPITDALGSMIAQADATARVDHFNIYHIWGSLQAGSLSDGPGYAGQVHDTNTGLSYAQQRYYDPTIPGFLSIDPVGVDTATGGNFNRYWYASDNPYRFTDPAGTCDGAANESKSCDPNNVSPLLLPEEGPNIFEVTGQAIATDIAYVQGLVTGNQALMNEAASGFQESVGTKAAVAAIFALGTSGEGGEGGVGYRSFPAFKRAAGPAGEGMEWHHVVGQTTSNIERFGQEAIHNTNNLVRLDVATHRQINAFYATKPLGSDMTVRQLLSTQSFEEQYNFGQQIVQDFGGGK